jgi:tRNA G37 N-methylase Trm5
MRYGEAINLTRDTIMMRHLIVPNHEVEPILGLLRDNGWLASGMLIFSSEEGDCRMVPLDPDAPASLPSPLDTFAITKVAGKEGDRIDSDWLNHLSLLVDQDLLEENREEWPSSHEFIGDMMIVRIEDAVSEFTSQIAEAKLRSHPHVRLVLRDEGVHGEFRIRNLTSIGAWVDGEVVTEDIPESASSTRVLVRETGRSIACDPNRAYFSTKLQTERLETLALSKQLALLLGRPIRVCDPFCGVGPALCALLSERGLVSDAMASDLNPDAIELLIDNLRRWDRRDYPPHPAPIARIFDDRVVGIADATEIAENPSFSGRWDLLLVNLPHRTIDLLPSLVPLLDRGSPSMVRGRAIVAESEIEAANLRITEALPPILDGTPVPYLRIKRDYSSTLRLCSFEAWIAPMT